MPITENTFTADELSAAVTANPALAAELKSFGTKANFIVRTAEEDNTWKAGFEKSVADKKTSEFANGIEADIQSIYGQPKKENEKYHEYLKRVLTETTTGRSAIQKELDDLKAAGNGTPDDKARIKQLEALLNEKTTSFETTKKELEGKIGAAEAKGELVAAAGSVRAKYQKGLNEDLVKTFETSVFEAVQKQMRKVNDQFVIVDDKNEPILDPLTFKPKTVQAILEEKLKPIIDQGQAGAGGGTGNPGQGGGGAGSHDLGVVKNAEGQVTDITALPAEVKTQVDLTEYLKKLGISHREEVYHKIFGKFSEKLPIK